MCPEEDEGKSFHEKGELNRVPAPDIHYLAPSRMMEGVPQTQTDEEKALVYLGAPAYGGKGSTFPFPEIIFMLAPLLFSFRSKISARRSLVVDLRA